jgi:hypothetical protein
MTDKPTGHTHTDPNAGDDHMGAVEGDTPSDTQQGNNNATAVNDEGQPDPLAVCEDVLGANIDGSEGG